MSAHVLLNLLNELGKRDKMRGLPFVCIGLIWFIAKHNIIYLHRTNLVYCKAHCHLFA